MKNGKLSCGVFPRGKERSGNANNYYSGTLVGILSLSQHTAVLSFCVTFWFHDSCLLSRRAEASAVLRGLAASRWVDRRTRAVLVEATLFNTATNLFTCVTLLLELPPAGGAAASAQVSSLHLYKYITAWDNFILACEVSAIDDCQARSFPSVF